MSLPAPMAFAAQLVGHGVDLTWTADASLPPGTLFTVQRWSPDAVPQAWTTVSETTGTTARVERLSSPVRHSFRVKASAGTQYSAWTSIKVVYAEPALPVVRIDTGGKPILDKETYVAGTFDLDPNGQPGAHVATAVEVKGRGNSTWTLPKKPYRVKLQSSTSLLGMPASRHWVLLANYLDRSQLRTFSAFGISASTGLAWTPRARHVELILNGEYEGVYQLVEHVRVAADRVNITSLGPTDITGDAVTGGYLIELDGWLPGPGEVGFSTRRHVPFTMQDPELPAPEQLAYIKDYVQRFEDALFSPSFADPTTGYAAYLDVSSLIDWYLVEEVTRNQDAFFSSTYMYKPRSQKLFFGPVWDFDLSMGSTNGWDKSTPDGWWVRTKTPWMARFFQDPAFARRVADRWDQLKPVFDAMPGIIDATGATLTGPIAADDVRWSKSPSPVNKPSFVSGWLRQRIAWIDSNIHP